MTLSLNTQQRITTAEVGEMEGGMGEAHWGVSSACANLGTYECLACRAGASRRRELQARMTQAESQARDTGLAHWHENGKALARDRHDVHGK